MTKSPFQGSDGKRILSNHLVYKGESSTPEESEATNDDESDQETERTKSDLEEDIGKGSHDVDAEEGSVEAKEDVDAMDGDNPFGKGGVSRVGRSVDLSLNLQASSIFGDKDEMEEDPFADGVEYSPTHSPTFSPTHSTPDITRTPSVDTFEGSSGSDIISPSSSSSLTKFHEERRGVNDGGIGLSYPKDGMIKTVRSESLGQQAGGFMLMDAMLDDVSYPSAHTQDGWMNAQLILPLPSSLDYP